MNFQAGNEFSGGGVAFLCKEQAIGQGAAPQ
jgi:hypothetical protein